MTCVRAEQGAGAELYTGGEGRDCTIRTGGAERIFTLYEPADLPDGPVPLVIALHGEGGPDATRFVTAAASRWDLQADRAGVLVAFPEAEDGDWNDGGTGTPDDVGFMRDMIAAIDGERSVDASRVFATGWSAGGWMAHRIGCALSDRVAAIAVLHAGLEGPCEPAGPLSVLQLIGTRDTVLSSGAARAGTARWRELLGCPAPQRREQCRRRHGRGATLRGRRRA